MSLKFPNISHNFPFHCLKKVDSNVVPSSLNIAVIKSICSWRIYSQSRSLSHGLSAEDFFGCGRFVTNTSIGKCLKIGHRIDSYIIFLPVPDEEMHDDRKPNRSCSGTSIDRQRPPKRKIVKNETILSLSWLRISTTK